MTSGTCGTCSRPIVTARSMAGSEIVLQPVTYGWKTAHLGVYVIDGDIATETRRPKPGVEAFIAHRCPGNGKAAA